MFKIKLSVSGQPQNVSIQHFLGTENNTYKGCQFFINDDSCQDADYWLILDHIEKKESCLIDPKNIFLLHAEVLFPKSYWDAYPQYLDQFAKIFTCHDIFKDNVRYTLPFLPYMLFYKGGNLIHGNSVLNPIDRYIEDLVEYMPQKNKTLSVICSAKNGNEHHTMRLKFVQKLKEHFKDKLDWFGAGINPVEQKLNAIAPYKYHLALENYSSYNNITEKLYDSYLGLSYPIYYGAPNAKDYFPTDSFSQINIADLKGSTRQIEEIIDSNLYEKNFNSLKKAQQITLDEFNVFKRMAEITLEDSNRKIKNKKELITIDNYLLLKKKKTFISRMKRKISFIF